MKNISRLTVAVLLVGLLVLIATGVWAAPKFHGTVPQPIFRGRGFHVERGTFVVRDQPTTSYPIRNQLATSYAISDQSTTSFASDTGSGIKVDMGTVVIKTDCKNCVVTVDKVDPLALGLPGIASCYVMDLWCYPVQDKGKEPITGGKLILGDVFKISIEKTGTVNISFSFPPEFVKKAAKIYKLDTSLTPPTWTEVPGAVVNADGTISVDVTEDGIYSLIGKK